jgi:hypothetical protein
MFKHAVVVVAFVLSLGCLLGSASAEELFGVQVYPGATLDKGTTGFLKDSLNVNGAAYVSKDSLSKVVEFYKGRNGLKPIFENQEGAMFKRGGVVDVTIQNPWMDMQSGTMRPETLISIVSNE